MGINNPRGIIFHTYKNFLKNKTQKCETWQLVSTQHSNRYVHIFFHSQQIATTLTIYFVVSDDFMDYTSDIPVEYFTLK